MIRNFSQTKVSVAFPTLRRATPPTHTIRQVVRVLAATSLIPEFSPPILSSKAALSGSRTSLATDRTQTALVSEHVSLSAWHL
jgi:hypothetical protein